MTLDYQGNLDLYFCEQLSALISCKSVVAAGENIQGKFDTVKDQVSYGSNMVQSYAFTKSGDKNEASVLIAFYFRNSAKIFTQVLKINPIQTAFTSDSAGNLFIAFAIAESALQD